MSLEQPSRNVHNASLVLRRKKKAEIINGSHRDRR